MFDSIKGMAQIGGLLKDLPRLKQQLEEAKAKLAEIEVEAETGGGAVRVRASGDLRIRAVEIDQALLGSLIDANNEDDRFMAQDLIAGAVNAALTKAREAAEQQLMGAAGDMGLPFPPDALQGML